jgi:hypothetical protein
MAFAAPRGAAGATTADWPPQPGSAARPPPSRWCVRPPTAVQQQPTQCQQNCIEEGLAQRPPGQSWDDYQQSEIT